MAYTELSARSDDTDNILLSKIASVLSAANGGIFPPKLGDSEQVLLFKIASIIKVQYGSSRPVSQTDEIQVLLSKIAGMVNSTPNTIPNLTDEENTSLRKWVNAWNEEAGTSIPDNYLDESNTLLRKALMIAPGL